ncbi:large neutral amino acids transporter small subunit 3-like [Saccoglossus kowalevskii]
MGVVGGCIQGRGVLRRNLCHSESNIQEQLYNSTNGTSGDYTGCVEQDKQLNLIWTVTSSMMLIWCFPAGILYDCISLWKLRLGSSILFIASVVMLVFITKETPYLLIPAISLASLSGVEMSFTVFEVSTLTTVLL